MDHNVPCSRTLSDDHESFSTFIRLGDGQRHLGYHNERLSDNPVPSLPSRYSSGVNIIFEVSFPS